MKRFNNIDKTSGVIGLLVLIGTDLYIRLWHIKDLFYWVLDYDEGAYSVGGRIISQGNIPYKDFVLVHPPLYDLFLSGIYKIFGYNFYYGRYFSVVLSILCVVLVYFIVKKLFGKPAAFLAGLFLIFMPGLFQLWYRVVQEPLGILFTLASIWFLTDYIKTNNIKAWKLIVAGIFLGLAISVKYTFAIGFVGLLLILFVKDYRKSLKPILLYTGGTIIGFLMICGYFLISTPQEFISQTLLSQASYRTTTWGMGLINAFRNLQIGSPYTQLTAISVIIVYVMAIILLLWCIWQRKYLIWAIPLFITSLFCLIYNPLEARYLVIPCLFLIFGVSSIFAKLELSTRLSFNWSLLIATGCSLLIIVCLATSIAIMRDYNWTDSKGNSYEKQAYLSTISYLRTQDAVLVYSTNPIIYALAPTLNSSKNFDTFALLEIAHWDNSKIVGNPRYIVIDPMMTLFAIAGRKEQINLLSYMANLHGDSVRVIPPVENEISSLNLTVIKLY
jgi:dolichyl-phosphate-mannose--protein O-mannosyl transferase